MSGLLNSSIGRKLIMSISGLFLVLFLLFHMSMNLVAVFSGDAYNAVCGFLGTNWYALAGTAVLALGVVVHIVYAFILSFKNRAARGADRYEVTAKPKNVEWASQNMLVLGIIVCLGIALHLFNFWYNMMCAELLHVEGLAHSATDGAAWVAECFQNPVYAGLYLVWFVALWFHLTHGFWSALQTLGWNGNAWIKRLECISFWYATIVCGLFAVIVIGFFFGVFPIFG
ncbi:MAG: succinate dehydrogenase/fumarate reductase cytochrome b subunit [Bacteroidales bacterium]|nr:succinate dehydrogenase/fumarate reductase cytochrome b subunit [Bacteroidales bacterium]